MIGQDYKERLHHNKLDEDKSQALTSGADGESTTHHCYDGEDGHEEEDF